MTMASKRSRKKRKRRGSGIYIFLIILLLLFIAGVILYSKFFGFTKEEADLNDYFSLTSDNQAGVVIDNSVMGAKGIVSGGAAYVEYDTVSSYISSRFYVDTNEVGELRERINSIGQVTVGSVDDTSVARQLAEIFYYRAAFSSDEVQKLVTGGMLKSSLEIYVPTAGADQLDNLAMSLNTVQYVAPQPANPTAIGSAKDSAHNGKTYTLDGITAHTHRGILVTQGKKFLSY